MNSYASTDMKPDVSILIVCYKSLDYIDDCLSSLFRFVVGCRFEVLLLDCSEDGTIEFVRESYPSVRIVDNHENIGFSKGNNRLAEQARGKYLLLLNADTYLTDDAVSELYRCAERYKPSELGAIGGRARLPDGRRDPGSRQSFPTLTKLAISTVGGAKWLNGALPENATQPGAVESLSGAFMMVPASVWEAMGGLDESFFAYCEEMDFCHRLQIAGLPVIMTPTAEIVHLGGGGSHRSERSVMKAQALMHLLRKHWSSSQVIAAGLLIWSHGLARAVAGYIGKPISRQKSAELVSAFGPLVRSPRSWWHGFRSGQ